MEVPVADPLEEKLLFLRLLFDCQILYFVHEEGLNLRRMTKSLVLTQVPEEQLCYYALLLGQVEF